MDLHIDIETYSGTDLRVCGVKRYTEDPDFDILLFAWSYGDQETEVVDLANGGQIPVRVLTAMRDPDDRKFAHNAAFEITCINEWLRRRDAGFSLDPKQWVCTMVVSARAGLPLKLELVGAALGATAQKDKDGEALIRFFSIRCKPTKANGMRTRNLPRHDWEKWISFIGYVKGDVDAEREISHRLAWLKFPAMEQDIWVLDQKINSVGICVDPVLARSAMQLEKLSVERLTEQIIELTQQAVTKAKSTQQVKAFIKKFTATDESDGVEVNSVNKKIMPELLELFKDNKTITELLNLRSKLGRTSAKKYDIIIQSMCKTKRVYDLLQYYGANRTGRWAGRRLQVQNFKRNKLKGKDLKIARDLVRRLDIDRLDLLFDDIGGVVAELIRTALVPAEGCKLIPSDFSAIEARVTAWLAGEEWRLKIFAQSPEEYKKNDIYKVSYANMFHIPVDKITDEERQRGKVAELALGYQGAVGALEQMGGKDLGLTEAEMLRIVKAWRAASPAIKKYWYKIQAAAERAIGYRERTTVGNVSFHMTNGHLFVTLPSGRPLIYQNARLQNGKILYRGVHQKTKKWGWLDTYGGKLTENLVQATARDLLAEAMLRVDAAGLVIVMHVHDEIVVEAREEEAEEVKRVLHRLMLVSPDWAKGLPLGAETNILDYYQK